MIVLRQGTWLERVKLLQTFLAWAGWLTAVLGVLYFVANVFWIVNQLQELPPSERSRLWVWLLSGAARLFDWVFPFFCWAVLTLLLHMYDIFREWSDDEEPAVETESANEGRL